MSKNKEIIPNFWSVYYAINFKRFSKTREFVDANTGEKLHYSFRGQDIVNNDLILSVVSVILWMSPALLVVLVSTIYARETLWSFFFGVLAVILYHFLGMYYVIRGPMIEYTREKKKFFFG